jgi:hypothetical protein
MIVLLNGHGRRYGVRVSLWRQFVLSGVLLTIGVYCGCGFGGVLTEGIIGRLPLGMALRDAGIYATVCLLCTALGLGAAINGWRALSAYGRAVFW